VRSRSDGKNFRSALTQFASALLAYRLAEADRWSAHHRGKARAPPDLPVKQALGGLPAAALQSEEFESFLDELRVELEDAAVAGVGVGHQLTVRQAAGQVG
jgi:hypothetical protein